MPGPKRDDTKRQLANGLNPAEKRKQERQQTKVSGANTFEAIAREWHALQQSTWVPVHAHDVIHSLERDVFPTIGNVPIASRAGLFNANYLIFGWRIERSRLRGSWSR